MANPPSPTSRLAPSFRRLPVCNRHLRCRCCRLVRHTRRDPPSRLGNDHCNVRFPDRHLTPRHRASGPDLLGTDLYLHDHNAVWDGYELSRCDNRYQ